MFENGSSSYTGGGPPASGNVVTHLDESGTSLDTGIIAIQTSDDKKVTMPITGMDGTTFLVLITGIGAVVSILGLGYNAYRKRREDTGTEDRAATGRR